MATTQTVQGINELRGPSDLSTLVVFEVPVQVAGTYDSAARPTFDFAAALQAQRHRSNQGVVVKSALMLRPLSVGVPETRYNVPNANIVLSGANNKDITFRVASTGANGDAGTEVADSTALNGSLVLLVTALITAA